MAPVSKTKSNETTSKKAPAPTPKLKWISTRLLDDVFTYEVSLFKPHFEVDYEASASSQTATASVGFDYVQIFLGAKVGVLDAFFQSIFASFGLYFQTGIDFILALPSRLNEIVRFFGI